MDWRTLVVAVVVALPVVTAGCSGLSNGGERTRTATPVPVPDVETAASTPDGVAPGVAGGGVADVDRLAAAHAEVVDDASYVWHSRLRIDRLPRVSGDEHVVLKDLRVESERRYRYYTNRRNVHSRGDARLLSNVSEYADGRTVFQRYRPFGDVAFSYYEHPVEPANRRYSRVLTSPIRQYLAVPNATVAAARVNGREYYRIEADRPSAPGLVVGSNFSVTALVSPRGFVRSLNVTYEVQRGTRVEAVRYSFRYDRHENVTVEPPEWLTARRSASTVPVDRDRHRP